MTPCVCCSLLDKLSGRARPCYFYAATSIVQAAISASGGGGLRRSRGIFRKVLSEFLGPVNVRVARKEDKVKVEG
jgi:hypothetical protein